MKIEPNSVCFKVTINCQTSDGSEFFLDGERISIIYYRTEKFPLSNFSMIVTPLKFKTSLWFDRRFKCNEDFFLLFPRNFHELRLRLFHWSLLYRQKSRLRSISKLSESHRRSPMRLSSVIEVSMENFQLFSFVSENQRKPLSLRSKIILMIVLSMLISFDVVSILVCYFCCGISNQNRFELIQKKRKSSKLKNYSLSKRNGFSLFSIERHRSDRRRCCHTNSAIAISFLERQRRKLTIIIPGWILTSVYCCQNGRCTKSYQDVYRDVVCLLFLSIGIRSLVVQSNNEELSTVKLQIH